MDTSGTVSQAWKCAEENFSMDMTHSCNDCDWCNTRCPPVPDHLAVETVTREIQPCLRVPAHVAVKTRTTSHAITADTKRRILNN